LYMCISGLVCSENARSENGTGKQANKGPSAKKTVNINTAV
jgi:hypothetical protein